MLSGRGAHDNRLAIDLGDERQAGGQLRVEQRRQGGRRRLSQRVDFDLGGLRLRDRRFQFVQRLADQLVIFGTGRISSCLGSADVSSFRSGRRSAATVALAGGHAVQRVGRQLEFDRLQLSLQGLERVLDGLVLVRQPRSSSDRSACRPRVGRASHLSQQCFEAGEDFGRPGYTCSDPWWPSGSPASMRSNAARIVACVAGSAQIRSWRLSEATLTRASGAICPSAATASAAGMRVRCQPQFAGVAFLGTRHLEHGLLDECVFLRSGPGQDGTRPALSPASRALGTSSCNNFSIWVVVRLPNG